MKKIICPYCGCGCLLNISEDLKLSPEKSDPVSEGRPCLKGITCSEFHNINRIKKPQIRKGNKLVPVSWKTAYEYINKNIKRFKPEEFSFLAGNGSNEDAFLFQKFARDYVKTENIDSCARICHSASAFAFNEAFGITRMPAKIKDYENADLILLIGTNPKATYPVAFNYILKAKKKKAKLICVRDWKDETSKHADLFVEILDGTQIAFLNCILYLLVKNKKVKVPKELESVLEHYDIKTTENICKIKKGVIKKVYKLVSKSKNFVLGYGMGMTQHSYGTSNVLSAINLVIAKNGKIISMRGKSNIQGINDMGICPRKTKGKTIIETIFSKRNKFLWVMEMNPAQSLPDLSTLHKNLRKMFLVYQGPFYNKTTEFANVVLPSCSFLEYEGTCTNAESRVRYSDKVIEPLYNSKENWKIFNEIAGFKYKDTGSIWKDISKIHDYKHINLSSLKKDNKGKFVNYKVKHKIFIPVEFISLEGKTSQAYPYLLTTERLTYQFCTGTMSSRSSTLNKLQPEPFCLLNQVDANKLRVKDGDLLLISSKDGSIRIKTKIDNNFPKGLVSVPFHFEDCLVNKLFPVEFDPFSYNTNLKKIAVNIERIF